MFDIQEVIKAIKIQQLGYTFLMYLTDKIDSGKLTFSRVHEDENASDIILNWIKDNYDYLPPSILPSKDEIQEFSNYFASYLTTSFEFTETPERMNNPTECYCSVCFQFVNLSHLKSISPRKHDKMIAAQKRLEIINELALFYRINLSHDECKLIADDELHMRDIAYLAYIKALFKRIQFSEGGVYILALWRQFAWKRNGGPIKGFKLEVDEVFNAMQRVQTRLMNH